MKRKWTDAPNDQRCRYDITLRDGSKAQCGRRRVNGDYCKQHQNMEAARAALKKARGK